MSKCGSCGIKYSNTGDFEKPWLFHVLADLEYPCILGIDFIGVSKIILDFHRKSLAIQDSQVEDIKVDDWNLRVDLSETKLNVVANVLDNNTIESIIREKVNCAIIRDLVLSSRDQLIEEQKTDPEIGHIYRYLENPENSSVNAAICENWSRDFRLVEGLLFYAKYATSFGEMRVYIPKSLRNEIMRVFHDKPLAGHFGRFKTYHKIRDVCYFPYMRKFIDQYVSTCHMCQINNYKNALPAGRLIPIVSNYPNEIVTFDLLGPYPVSRVRRNRYVLVITDHFSKWAEIIPLKKYSARDIADNFFDNYISRFGAPIKFISDKIPQFISDIFENLSERLGIRHVKTVVYRPQANRTERVNRDLVQMIANYVNEQHDTWDQFLREFAYAIHTAVNETTVKTPAELFLGRKLITPFQKLVMESDGTEFAVGDIERLFEETRRNTETNHENWKKYYNRHRRDVQIKVNDWILVATHHLSSATRKVVAKFKPKFEGPYRVLDVKNNDVVIWKAGKRLTINVDLNRIYRQRKCDETEIGTGSSDNGSLRDESSGFDRVRRRSNDSRDGIKKGSKVKRELEGKGIRFRNNQGEKHTNKTNKCGPLIRSIPSSWSEKDRMIKKGKNQEFRYKRANESRSGGPERKVQKGSEHRVNKRSLSSNYKTNHNLTKYRKKSRKEETVTTTISGYNLRPRIGKREESRPTIERKTQQGGPSRSRKGRERNDSPYIEERTILSNKNARRGGD
ncbi:hypothetical protein TNCV_2507061 [Trichonephila clavipes]|nr:hypothetical protein TNCV_2507061 [Trichonephila clavipes]